MMSTGKLIVFSTLLLFGVCLRLNQHNHPLASILQQKLDAFCIDDFDCNGMKICVDNACQEPGRPPKDYNYRVDETATKETDIVKYPWYTMAEARQSRCTNSKECDGTRVCSYGFCKGVARPAKNPAYVYDESITQGKCPNLATDPNYINRDYYCRSSRKCSASGSCEDLAPKSANYVFDEGRGFSRCPFGSDPNVPVKDYFCDGLRTCSEFGWCQGKAR